MTERAGSTLLVRGGRWLDLTAGDWQDGDVLIREGRIVEVGDLGRLDGGVAVLDASGGFVLPGLIDAHVHVTATTADLAGLASSSPSYVAFGAARLMGDMLDRGFTTVRDVAGADYGIHQAQAEGLVRGPRIFFGGKAISQTGGHGDPRHRGQDQVEGHYCCPSIGRIADGVDAIRWAARDELRRGAHHIKIMAGGGVASPTDRIDSTQYSLDEMRAAVDEAGAANRYVAAHAYTPRSIRRALEAGVRSIEHANLIDADTVDLLVHHRAFVTMNLVTYWALADEGERFGVPADQVAKVGAVLDGGIEALRMCHAAGVNPVFGTDLLGGMQRHQAREFAIRGEHLPAIDVLRSATSDAARLLQREGELGVIAEGAHGDLVIVDDDPLENLAVLAESRIRSVVQGGIVVAGTRDAEPH